MWIMFSGWLLCCGAVLYAAGTEPGGLRGGQKSDRIGYADVVKAGLLSAVDCSARQVAKDSDNPSEWTGGIFLCVKD